GGPHRGRGDRHAQGPSRHHALPRRGAADRQSVLGNSAMRTVGTGFVVAVVASALVAGQAAAQGPIKIGFLSPMSGAIAAAGKDMYSGCELYWQGGGWQVAGRELEVVLEGNE